MYPYQIYSINESPDSWRYDIGVNVLRADIKIKKPLVKWYEWQDKPIPEGLYNQWKEQNAFSKENAAILPASAWHRLLLDADKSDSPKLSLETFDKVSS
jgi:hypothetical protein